MIPSASVDSMRVGAVDMYLILHEHSSETVEELEGRDDLALYQYRRCYGRAGPVSGADRHLVPPLLKRELADSSSLTSAGAEHVVHIHCWVVVKGRAVSDRGLRWFSQ